jgi:hypothetical protein
MRPWCNLAASQRRPYCASMNSHSPVGLVSRQWDAVDWACVLCDRHIHNDRASKSASSRQCACPFYSSSAGSFGKVSHHPGLSAPLQPRFGSLRLLAFPQAKIAIEREICECDGHTVQTLSQWRLTGDWLAPLESDCSWMHSKVSYWLSSYIKATWPFLEILKMAGYSLDSPCTRHHAWWMTLPCLELWCAAGRSSLIQSLWSVRRCVADVWLAPPRQMADPVQAQLPSFVSLAPGLKKREKNYSCYTL